MNQSFRRAKKVEQSCRTLSGMYVWMGVYIGYLLYIASMEHTPGLKLAGESVSKSRIAAKSKKSRKK